MFFRIFAFIFFTVKAAAVQSGNIFWEVKKPGSATPNYLIGTKHDVILNENSLPPEVIAALENTKVGLFEIISNELTEEALIEAVKNNIKLPPGKTLSFYIGQEKAQTIFLAFQSTLSRLNEETLSALSDESKQLGVDITSYSDFNNFKPSFVTRMIDGVVQLLENQTQEKLQKAEMDQNQKAGAEIPDLANETGEMETALLTEDDGERDKSSYSQELMEADVSDVDSDGTFQIGELNTQPDMKTCLLHKATMDDYIENTLSCMEKPVHSLESVEGQISALSSTNEDRMADMLNLHFEKIIALLEGRFNGTERAVIDVSLLLKQLRMNVQNSVMQSYHQNLQVDSDSFKLNIPKFIADFLTEKQCSVLPEASINQYVDQMIVFSEFYLQAFLKGKPIEGEVEQELKHLISEIGISKRAIISTCFPDYIWPENMGEQIEKGEKFALDSLKKQVESVLISRDQKMTKSMLPYFEEGGVFAAVGFGHLSGVLEEFQAQGYEIRNIEFSTSLREAEYFEDKKDESGNFLDGNNDKSE